jgi:hypothetical protein
MEQSRQHQIDENKAALRYLVNQRNNSTEYNLLLELRINDRKQALKKLIKEY